MTRARRQLPALLSTLPVLLVLAVACARPPPQQPLDWRKAAPGLEYSRTTVRPDPHEPDVAVHLLRLDPAQVSLQVVEARLDLGRPLAEAVGFRKAAHALAAVNGGYFDPQFKPLGLLVSQGRELSHLRRVDHGIFYIAGQHAGLQHARQWQPPAQLEFAVECGPRLLVDGKPLAFKAGVARRVAIGADARGRVVLVVTEGVLTLTELAHLLATPTAKGGPELVQALNLDGGSSTMLDVDAGPVQAVVRSAVQVPVGLAVVPRPVDGDRVPSARVGQTSWRDGG